MTQAFRKFSLWQAISDEIEASVKSLKVGVQGRRRHLAEFRGSKVHQFDLVKSGFPDKSGKIPSLDIRFSFKISAFA